MQVLDTVNVSLDAPALGAENVTTKDMLEDLHPSPEDQAFGRELKELADEILAGAMTVLTTRERTIIQKRLLDEDPASLAEVGDALGVTRERVRQIEERAVAKLRSYVKRSGIFKSKMFS
jgi:RNA polymerase sigma-32 factor